MNKLLTTAAVLITLISAAQAAQPGKQSTPPKPNYVSAQDWLNRCNARELEWHAYCWAYTRAVADTASLWAEVGEGPFCIDGKWTSDQLVAVGRKYLAVNPKLLSEGAASALALAFRDTFPCNTKLPGKDA